MKNIFEERINKEVFFILGILSNLRNDIDILNGMRMKNPPASSFQPPAFLPELFWFSRQRAIKFNQNNIQSLVAIALPECLSKPRHANSSLPATIEISFLNDRAIAKVHADFCHDPTPTDVITFRHSPELGEILIGVPTVAYHAKKFHQSLDHEIALCVIHGLLHLLDYDDIDEKERLLMHEEQNFLLQYAVKHA